MAEQTELIERTRSPKEWLEGKWQTVEGMEVDIRHVETEVVTQYPLWGFLDGMFSRWTISGAFCQKASIHDLVPAPKKHTRWVNFYPKGHQVHSSLEVQMKVQ